MCLGDNFNTRTCKYIYTYICVCDTNMCECVSSPFTCVSVCHHLQHVRVCVITKVRFNKSVRRSASTELGTCPRQQCSDPESQRSPQTSVLQPASGTAKVHPTCSDAGRTEHVRDGHVCRARTHIYNIYMYVCRHIHTQVDMCTDTELGAGI